ncbi:MAG: phosphatase PAP2 family protein [Marinifilaceae bacterium]|jgi:hypothetical protein|nr:phosphatase PAP2 family protein [Marinifilaceae bacterium]
MKITKFILKSCFICIIVLTNLKSKAQFNKQILSDTTTISKRANTFSARTAIIGTGLITASFLMDDWIKDKLKSNQSNFLDSYTDVGNIFGEKKIMGSIGIACYVFSEATNNKRLKFTTVNSMKAVLCGAIITESLKISTGRARPDMNMGNNHFDFMGGNSNSFKSFPSGHSFVAWAMLTPFAEEYSKWIYLIPATVSFTRVYRNRHWSSDAVVGGLIGYLAGHFFQKGKNQKVFISANGISIRF